MADETRRKPTLSGPQERALLALLEGATLTAAAEAATVTRQTVSTWVNQDPAFIAEYQNRRAELWAASIARVEASMPKALDVLTGLLTDADWRARFAAATRILGHVFEHPGKRVVPRETTPEAVSANQESARRDAERMRLLMESLGG